MTKFIQKFYLLSYKTLSLAFFILLLVVIIGYSSSVLFYLVSNSWSTPLVLSPSQPKVLAFQPQVATLVSNIARHRAELQNSLLAKKAILEQLVRIDETAIRLEKIAKNEATMAKRSTSMLDPITAEKANNVSKNNELLETIKLLEEQINSELVAGLITKDQAAQRKIALQSSNISNIDLNLSIAQTRIQSDQLKDYSSTLLGANKSLSGLVPSKQLLDLDATKAQLTVQLDAINRSFDILKNSIAADTRILQVSMESPYYKALWEPVTVLFIPYENLNNVEEKSPVYSCRLEIIFCRRVGEIDRIFNAEEYGKHPMFKTDIKGKFATVIFTDKTAERDQVLFIGSKPLFI